MKFLRKMKSGWISLLLLFCFLPGARIVAQKAGHVPGSVLVSVLPGHNPDVLERRFVEIFPDMPLRKERKVSNLLQVWEFVTRPETDAEYQLLSWMRAQPEVRFAQFDHLLEWRGDYEALPPTLFPDDPLFSDQWQMVNDGSNGGVPNADLDAEEAWSWTTGGLTPAGDTIVIAIIDGGIDPGHPDLFANLWRNRHEIPGDNLDNDGNGYVDDFRGWNVYSQTDNIEGAMMGHGTSVSGIVGASGNNSIGISGVNWTVKMMFVAGNNPESAVLAAYDYILTARKLYNDTQGALGAFVVAANCSWGVNYGQPSEAPLWCAAFDSLGQAGIVSVAATANIPVDVDAVGDLPTACPSDYLITVTSLDRSDQIAATAAWGAASIDLGAYGKEISTTIPGNNYAQKSGTSYAAPHVSGMIGLLYAAPCPNLIELAKTTPAQAALQAKKLILDAAPSNASLNAITLSGGRLNLRTVLEAYQSQCTPCPAPFAITIDNINAHTVAVSWAELNDYQQVFARWRPLGASDWYFAPNVQSPLVLPYLEKCTAYEIAFKSGCTGGEYSEWSEPVVFSTEGCCSAPGGIQELWVENEAAEIAWDSLSEAQGYELRVRTAGVDWSYFQTPENSFLLEYLSPCTDYEYQVRVLCDTAEVDFSNSHFFTTIGCGACLDGDYCNASASYALEEWISLVEIGNWKNLSGGFWGYENFTGALPDAALCLKSGETLPLKLKPGFAGIAYNEYFKIFVDFNMDGDFDDAGELAFDPGFAYNNTMEGFLNVPVFFNFGTTRMRVVMKFQNAFNLPPEACGWFDFGQVEDYCVHLLPDLVQSEQSERVEGIFRLYPQPATQWVNMDRQGNLHFPAFVSVLRSDGSLQHLIGEVTDLRAPLRIHVSNWPSGMYIVRIETAEGKTFFQKLIKM